MTDLQKEIDKAFKLVSAISVSGDVVDVMAAVRNHLRAAFDMAGKLEVSEDG